MPTTSSKSPRSRRFTTSGVSRRAKVVWAALVASMTAAGGVLLALDRTPVTSPDGLSLPALVATSGPDTVEVVFNTRAPLDAQRWQAIVIHDSGKPTGSP